MPTWGLAIGGPFLLLMLSRDFGSLVGLLVIFALFLIALPAIMSGLAELAPLFVVGVLALVAAIAVGRPLVAVIRAHGLDDRRRSLNWLTLALLVGAGLLISLGWLDGR